MINRRHPDINILPPPINNWITVCPYERCPISWARIPSIISSESKSNPSVMHSVCLPRANAFGAGSWIIFTFTFLGQYDVFSFLYSGHCSLSLFLIVTVGPRQLATSSVNIGAKLRSDIDANSCIMNDTAKGLYSCVA